MDTLRRDVTLAIRSLLRDRAFSIASVATLALGVGAITTLAAVVAGVLLAPLPYRQPDRLLTILHGRSVSSPVSPADFDDIRRTARSFSGIAAAQAWGANLSAEGRTERVPALQVSGTLFDVLGAAPLLGRTIAEHDVTGDVRVVVLAHRLWVRRFGSDSTVVGRPVVINGESYRVIGVMPPAFRFAPFWQTRAEAWVPLSLADRAADRGGRSLRVFARLRDGVSLDQARAELAAVNDRLTRDWPDTNTGLTTGAMLLEEKAVGPIRPLLLAVFGLAAGLLLVAAVNFAMLVVARMTSRQGELAIRAALGATDARLLRGLLIEGLLVGVLGAGFGLACSAGGTLLLARTLPADSLPPHAEIALSPAVLAFAVVIATLAATVATLAPGWRLGRVSAAGALQPTRTVAGSRASSRARSMLVGMEVTLAFVLAVAAMLFARTLVHLQHVELGLTPDRLVATSVSLDGANQSTAEARTAFFTSLTSGIAALPGVSSVSAINHLPLAGDLWILGYSVDGRPPAASGHEDGAAYRVVLPRYFATVEQAIRAGRDFTAADRAGSVPVVIVNQHLADRQWPGQSALGRRLRFGDDVLTVVGVVADVPQATLVEPIGDEMYFPLAQRPIRSATRSPMTLVVRTASDAPIFPALRDTVWTLDRQAAVYDGMTLADVLASETWRERLGAHVGAIFAGVALLLAAVGISSVVQYAVTRRWREFGVRLALGATRGHVVTLAVREAAAPVLAGLLAGAILVALTARLLGSLLVGVAPHDPIAIASAALALLVVSLLAAWRPAARASRVDPGIALREA
jgi:putative ABC transport system permease protein